MRVREGFCDLKIFYYLCSMGNVGTPQGVKGRRRRNVKPRTVKGRHQWSIA